MTPFYVHLGSSNSLGDLRKILEKRFFQGKIYENPEETLRIQEAKFCAKEGRTEEGCPIANDIIRRTSPNEKFLVVGKDMKNSLMSCS